MAVSYDAFRWDAKENREGITHALVRPLSRLFDHLSPKFESQVFTLRISKLKAKLFLVPFL